MVIIHYFQISLWHRRYGGFILLLKRVAALLLAAGSFGVAAAAPLIVLRAVPTVSCITPNETLYEKRISASGTIEAQNVREIYLDTPVMAQTVNVSVGDRVVRDDVLAVIDTETTRSIMQQSVPASILLSGITEALPADTSDLLGMYSALKASGLDAELGPLDDLAQADAARNSAANEANTYIYVPDVITAPIDGIVTDIEIKSGMLSRTAKPVITISDTGSFVAMVTVGESYVSDIKVGDEAIIEGTGFPDKTYHGHVSRIYPVARKQTGTTAQETVVDVEISIDDPDDHLKAGFTVRAQIVTDMRRTMLTVPYEAVGQDENNEEYVYVADGARVERRTVKTGMELLEGVDVVEGLSPNDILLSDVAAARADSSI